MDGRSAGRPSCTKLAPASKVMKNAKKQTNESSFLHKVLAYETIINPPYFGKSLLGSIACRKNAAYRDNSRSCLSLGRSLFLVENPLGQPLAGISVCWSRSELGDDLSTSLNIGSTRGTRPLSS